MNTNFTEKNTPILKALAQDVRPVYIDEFEKHGYTRRAKKLIEIGE